MISPEIEKCVKHHNEFIWIAGVRIAAC